MATIKWPIKYTHRAFPELRALPVELVRGRTLLVEDDPAAPLPSVRHVNVNAIIIAQRD